MEMRNEPTTEQRVQAKTVNNDKFFMDEWAQVVDPEETSVYQQFEKKLMNNYTDYINDWLTKSPSELIEDAENIALTKCVYENLSCGMDCNCDEYLMRFENPLALVCDQCAAEREMTGSFDIEHILRNILDKRDMEQVCALDSEYAPPEMTIDKLKEQLGDEYKFTAIEYNEPNIEQSQDMSM
jgi:hypothetical protein